MTSKESKAVSPWLRFHQLDLLGWPESPRNLPFSASQLLTLQVCATMPSSLCGVIAVEFRSLSLEDKLFTKLSHILSTRFCSCSTFVCFRLLSLVSSRESWAGQLGSEQTETHKGDASAIIVEVS